MELKSLLKLLRSQGVIEYHSQEGAGKNFFIKLSEELPKSTYKKKKEEEELGDPPDPEKPFDELSFEEQLFYSSDPTPIDET